MPRVSISGFMSIGGDVLMFGNDKESLRQFYYDVWDKQQNGATLSPLEQQIAAVMLEHPEYQVYLSPLTRHTTAILTQDDTNPFMHMGLHLALRDQVSLDRPAGIQALFNTLLQKTGDKLTAEHKILPILADVLAAAFTHGHMPDERVYLERVARDTTNFK